MKTLLLPILCTYFLVRAHTPMPTHTDKQRSHIATKCHLGDSKQPGVPNKGQDEQSEQVTHRCLSKSLQVIRAYFQVGQLLGTDAV